MPFSRRRRFAEAPGAEWNALIPGCAVRAIVEVLREFALSLNLIPVCPGGLIFGGMNEWREDDENTKEDEAACPADDADEALRRLAVLRLAEHLEIGGQLVARCQALADTKRGDRLGPLTAAARLMRANVQVAQTLAHVALVERRRRTIVERIQTSDPQTAELNSQKRNPVEQAEHELKYWRRMNEDVEDAVRIRTGQSDGRDRFLLLIKLAEEKLARAKQERDGYG